MIQKHQKMKKLKKNKDCLKNSLKNSQNSQKLLKIFLKNKQIQNVHYNFLKKVVRYIHNPSKQYHTTANIFFKTTTVYIEKSKTFYKNLKI